MDALQAIHTRRSIRKYLNKPVPQEVLQQVLKAAMYAPSACNQQPWQFVVIEDRKLLGEVPKIHPYATMAAEAPLAILVCCDTTLEQVPGYWVIDCSAAVAEPTAGRACPGPWGCVDGRLSAAGACGRVPPLARSAEDRDPPQPGSPRLSSRKAAPARAIPHGADTLQRLVTWEAPCTLTAPAVRRH